MLPEIEVEGVPILEEFVQKYPYRYKINYDAENDIGYAYLKKKKGYNRYEKRSTKVRKTWNNRGKNWIKMKYIILIIKI